MEGFDEEMEYRKAKLEILREAGQLFLPFEQRIDVSTWAAANLTQYLKPVYSFQLHTGLTYYITAI